jgi:hypothetical protein
VRIRFELVYPLFARTEDKPDSGHAIVDSVYRTEPRRVLAALIRLPGDFDLAEKAVMT